MFLADLFQYLSQGELSQVALGTENSGRVSEDDYAKLITHINLGLTNIYSRLPLKQKQQIIKLRSSQTIYTIAEDALKIEEVYSETGQQYALNDASNEESLYTPAHNQLQVPVPLDGAQVAVLYRANHERIPPKRSTDPNSVLINIPDTLIEPLLQYVASRVMQSRGTAESISEANAYMQRYEFMLQQVITHGLYAADIPTNTRLRDNGWV